LLAVRRKTSALLPVAAIENGGFKVGHGLALNHETAGANLFTTKAYPNISNLELFYGPV
jgi:hypothetical protein